MKNTRQYITWFLILIMAFSNAVCVNAAFLEDEIFFDDLESYAVGYVPEGIFGWGANSDKPVSVQEVDGNKVIQFGNERSSFGNFGRVQYGPYTGQFWVTVDLLFPDTDFTSFRLTYNNSKNQTLAVVNFDSSGKVKLVDERTETGAKVNTLLCSNLPIDGWVTFRVHIDTNAQKLRFLYKAQNDTDFTAVDGEYNFTFKNWDGASADQKVCDLHRMQFANRQEGLAQGTYFYLDNFGLYYDREIVTSADKNYVERKEVLDISDQHGYGYTFPETVNLGLTGGVLRDLPVVWRDSNDEIVSGYHEFSSVGEYVYKGTFENTNKWVKLTLDVRDRQITSIDEVYDSTYQFESYTPPKTVPALMNDGSYKNVKVVWDTYDIDTSATGVSQIEGTVLLWNNDVSWTQKVTLHLGITIYGVTEVKDLYVGVKKGESYALPDRVEAMTEEGGRKDVAVSWTGPALDTDTVGVYQYSGAVSGFIKPIKLFVTVYEENRDDENIKDALLEYYENVLTHGRDRTRYGVPASEPNPVFAAGINRLTGEHAMWQHQTAGDIPLTDLASQTCLMKGLLGMTQITDDDKYRQSVYDAYKYYLDNLVYEQNGLLAWGGHMAFNMKTYEVWDELDTHELKDHYPLFDVMYEIDPEKTERCIKAIWAGHVHDTTNLEFSRHFTITGAMEDEKVDNVFRSVQANFDKNLEPFFEASEGLITFVTAANDFVFAAGELYGLTGDIDALQSGLDLQNMYLKGRHDGSLDGKEPTGLIPFLFTKVGKYREFIEDVWDPLYTNSGFGDRIKPNLYDLDQNNPYLSDFGAEYDKTIDIVIYCYNPMVMFRMAEYCDEETKKYLIDEAVETLAAFVRTKYDFKTNQGKPMLIDGTDLTGYVRKRTGYTGQIGATFEPWELEADYLLAFMRGYVNAHSYDDEKLHDWAETIWSGIRNSFEYYGVGDVGSAPGVDMELNYDTDCEQPFVLITLCEAYNRFGVPEYLTLARKVANNIVNNRFQEGYFYEKDTQLSANFNAEEPYALVYFLASTMGISENVPEHFGSRGYFQFDWYNASTNEALKKYSSIIWAQTVSGEVLASAIALNTAEIELKTGEKYTLMASIEPEDTADQSIEWRTSNKDVCIVNEDGVVTAVAPGEAEITATAVSGGCEASTKVTVK